MKELRKMLLAVLVGTLIAVGAFAQKSSNDNRPPKEQPRVVDREKETRPPSNRGQSNNNRKRS